MSPTITMLAAGLLVAQTAGPSVTNTGKTCNCQKGATTGVIQPVSATTPSSGFGLGLFRGSSESVAVADERPSFFAKIQSFFGKKTSSETIEPSTIVAQPTPEQLRPGQYRQMQRLPSGQPSGINVITPATPVTAPVAPAKALQPVTYQGVPPSQLAPAANNSIVSTTVIPSSRPNRISADLVGKVGRETDYSWITGQLRIEDGQYAIHYATPEVVDTHNGSLALTSDRDLRGFQDGDFVSVRGQISGNANGRATYRVTNIDRMPR